MNYTKIIERLELINQIAKSRKWFIKNELQIGNKASNEEINSFEVKIGKQLPNQLKELLLNMSKSVNLYYQIEEAIPKEFGQIFAGEFWYNLESIEELNNTFPEWIAGSLDIESNDIESIQITKKIKDNKTAFLENSTGDIIAVDDISNEIIYFDHEGDTMHGKRLGKDLNSFLNQWSKMGFFGTEGWQFEEMYDFNANKLRSLDDGKVKNWINWVFKKAS